MFTQSLRNTNKQVVQSMAKQGVPFKSFEEFQNPTLSTFVRESFTAYLTFETQRNRHRRNLFSKIYLLISSIYFSLSLD